MNSKLPSEKVVISSPLSFSGSAARIWKITEVKNALLKYLLLVPIALALMVVAWLFVIGWYMLFGIFLIPYRLFRRGQRKEKRDRIRHREILQNLERR